MYSATFVSISVRAISVKNEENINRSDVQVMFGLYGDFSCLQVIYSKCNYGYQALPFSVDFKVPRELWNPLIKAVPGEFHGSGGHSERANVDKTEPICTGLEHDKLS